MPNYCSNCGSPLDLSNKCMTCGHLSAEGHKADHLCEYTNGVKRCPATGTMSKQTSGMGKWFCRAHFQNLNDRKICDQILDDYDLHGVPQPKDWRDELLENRMAGKHIKENETDAA